MSDLKPHEIFEQFTYLFEVKDHFFHFSLRRSLLSTSPPTGNRCIPLVDQPPWGGEVKPDNDNFIFGFIIGGMEPESECIFHVDPIRGGKDQTYTSSLSIGDSIHGQPPDGEVGRELGSFGRLCQGEFHDEICQHLPFDRCSWLVPNAKLTQLYCPFYQSS